MYTYFSGDPIECTTTDVYKLGKIILKTVEHRYASTTIISNLIKYKKKEITVHKSYENFMHMIPNKSYPSIFSLDDHSCIISVDGVNIYFSRGKKRELPSWVEIHNAFLLDNHILLVAKNKDEEKEFQTKLMLLHVDDCSRPTFVHSLPGVYEFISLNNNLLTVGTIHHDLDLDTFDDQQIYWEKEELQFRLITDNDMSLIVPKVGTL